MTYSQLDPISKYYELEEFDIEFDHRGGCGSDSHRQYVTSTTRQGKILPYKVCFSTSGREEECQDGEVFCDYNQQKCNIIRSSNIFCEIFEYDFQGCVQDEKGKYIIVPINFDISSINPNGSTSDKVNLRGTPNYDLRVYGWEYFDPFSRNWTALPSSLRNKENITFTAQEAFGTNFRNYLNRPIQYRIALCNGWSTDTTLEFTFIDASPKQVGTVAITDNTCFGANDGAATVTFDNNVDVANGFEMRYFLYQGNPADFGTNFENTNPPQAYKNYRLGGLIANGNGTFSGNTGNDIEPGNYYIVYQEVKYDGSNVTVKSGAITEQFTVRGPSQVVTSIASTVQPVCRNEGGTVNLSANGGTENGAGNLQYRIVGNNSWQASPTFINLLPGNSYKFQARRISGGNTCLGTETALVRINQVTTPFAINNFSITEIPFNPTSANGKLRVSMDFGTAPYIVTLRNANTNVVIENSISSNTSYTFQGLLPGDYYVEVTDASGCRDTSNVINLESLKVPQFSTPNVTQISCFEANNGAITIPVTNGGSYRWVRNGVVIPNKTTTTIDALKPGSYVLEVIPVGGDFSNPETLYRSMVINLVDPEKVAISNVVTVPFTCNGSGDGEIQLTPGGGNTYEYTLDGGLTWLTLTNNKITLANGGIFDLQIRNEKGCLSDITNGILVDEPGVLGLLVENREAITTYGGNEGFIDISVTRDANYTIGENFTFSWRKNGIEVSNREDLVNATSGVYTIEIRDQNALPPFNNGCVYSEEFTISEPNEITAVITDPSCYQGTDGTIALVVNQGNNDTEISFEWTNETTGEVVGTSNPVNGLGKGRYSVAIDGLPFGTSEGRNYQIGEPDMIEVIVENLMDVSSFGGTDGSLEIEVIGGTPPYTYQWIADNGFASTDQNIYDLKAGNYMLEVRDANATNQENGCVFIEAFEIEQPDIIVETPINPTCYNGCDGSISLLVNEGIGSFNYTWSNGMATPAITGLCAGSYTVTITGLPQGTQIRTYELDNPEQLIIPLPDTITFCSNQVPELDASIPEGNNITYDWTSDKGFTATGAVINPPQSGLYSVLAIDGNGCVAEHQIQVFKSDAVINSEFAMSSQIFLNDDLIMVDISFPVPDTVEWILPEEAKIKTNTADEVILTFSEPGVYQVGLKTTVGNCETTTIKEIAVLEQNTEDINPSVTPDAPKNNIENFSMYPNPSDGKFTVAVELGTTGAVSVKVFSFVSNQMMAYEKADRNNSYQIPFDISNLPSGVYAVVLETSYGSSLQKIVKK
ncbi:T9SS type A sorting domain-containing protein [Aquimarina sp. ERC-38]|uniref:T9SS type A sorting domain-containing protein n=1 Tax=Aquimarina sp. ERC-38 TaxID=2949996 RepID=UPI002246B671|nr:T9SS type A sorting domain-containing protein [Aquimarina sp. ERC-38]UZO82094.1 T9SS type A sorting domain-containing protein [Aquimarina sp. ERC-38]